MKFPICYLDPPWAYHVYSVKGKGRSAENHYKTQQLEWIKQMPILDVLEKNAVVFMWATYPNLREAFEVGDAWGLTYKTVAFTWAKLNKRWHNNALKLARKTPVMGEFVSRLMESSWFMANGYYTRANPEICLLWTRGKVLPRKSKAVRNLIVSPFTGKHSEKPIEAAMRIERLFDGAYLEVFARTYRPGWYSIGNDLDGLDIYDSLARVAQGDPCFELVARGNARERIAA